MKIRVLDRILVAVAGIVLLALCAAVLAQVFFNVDIISRAVRVLTTEAGWARAAIAVACVLLLMIGCYCVLVLFRHRSRRDRFIMQKMESGDLAISLKAMEGMVNRCLEQRTEIEPQSVKLENQRDGLVIRIRGTVASGISIPLTVDTLQKQIKQYVTACSGVEVKGIRVQIESSGEEAKDAPFAIDAPAPIPLLQGAEKNESKETKTTAAETKTDGLKESPQETEPAESAEPPASKGETTADPFSPEVPAGAKSAIKAMENLKMEYEAENEDERPIHQRLFSTPEEPCIMPLPPENLKAEETEDPKEIAEGPQDRETDAEEIIQPEELTAAETKKNQEPAEPEKDEIPEDISAAATDHDIADFEFDDDFGKKTGDEPDPKMTDAMNM